MKKIYPVLIFALFIAPLLPAQVSFKKFFGAPSNADFGADVHRTSAGDYLMLGTTAHGDNGFDFFLLETDASGASTGFEYYGGPKNEGAQRLVPLSDGGYLLLGYTESSGNGGEDGYAIRLNAQGTVQWTKTTGNTLNDYIADGVELPDGSLVIATNRQTPEGGTELHLERWTALGSLLNFHTLNNGDQILCRRLLATPDGILIAGIAEGLGFLSKIQSSNLSEIWFKNYISAGSTPQPLIRIEDMVAGLENNRYLAVGRTASPGAVNTVFTFDGSGDVLAKFNTLLSGAAAERLAVNTAGDIFIAGGDRIEHRDSAGLIRHANSGFDAPAAIPDNIRGLVALPSGGLAVAGNTQIYQQGQDVLFSLLDTALTTAAGQLYWNLGPDDSESGYSARQTADGGYLLCGEKYQPETLEDIWLIRTDAAGNVIWETTTGSSGIDVVRTIDLSGNDAFVVCGFSYDVQPGEPAVLFVRKIDLNGVELWAKFFPLGTPNFSPYALIRTLSDGGYIVALSAPLVSSTRKATLVRLDAQGNILWSKFYDGYSSGSFVRNLIETPEGNLLVTGAYQAGNIHATLFDPLGTQLWSHAYGGQSGTGYGLAATSDNHYILSGFTNTDQSGNDSLYVAKIDALGLAIWEQYFEGAAYFWPRAHVNEAGEIFLSASVADSGNREYAEIRKLDANGNMVWTREIEGLQNMLFFESQVTDDGGFMLFGYADRNNSRDYCLVKTDAEGIVNTRTAWPAAELPAVFPSLAWNEVYVSWQDPYAGPLTLSVFDAKGICLEQHHMVKHNGLFQYPLAVGHLPAGTYFVRMVTDEGIVFRPFIKG